MPSNDYSPLGKLSCGFDLSHVASLELYRTAGDEATVYAPGEFGAFADIHDLLSGLGSEDSRTLTGALNTAREVAELAGEFTAYITGNGSGSTSGLYAEDRVAIRYSAPFSVRAASANNPFGFDTADTVAIASGTEYVAVAPRDWTRGIIRGGSDTILTLTVGATEANAFVDSIYQNIPTMLRTWDLGDTLSGSGALSLTALENLGVWVNDTDVTARWILNAEGFVEYWRSSTRGALEWINADLRKFLGFTGLELDVNATGGMTYTRGTYRPHGMLWLARPIEYLEPKIRGKRRVAEAADGHTDTAHLSTRKGWILRFVVRGLAATEDSTVEALDGFLAYMWKAPHLTIYQNVNEVRRATRASEGYSLEVCGEDNYRVGRVRIVLDADKQDQEFSLEDPRVRLRYFMELTGNEYVP